MGTHTTRKREQVIIVNELRQVYPLKDLLELSDLSKVRFTIILKQKILEIFNLHRGRYGYRRILSILRSKGYTINHKTVLKLMRVLNLKGKQRKNGKYHSYKGEVGKVVDNLLKSDFTAYNPFEKLITDVTEFKVCNDKTYLSPVMGLYNTKIVSYLISLNPNLMVNREMLSGLFAKLQEDARALFHSDQVCQYQHA